MTRRQASYLLLLGAAIWGFAFVAQKEAMKYMGPFTFNGIRFALGALSLLPFLNLLKKDRTPPLKNLLPPGILAGVAIFFGVSFQQLGLLYTTAGKAGFITGLYVILVPILGLFFGKPTWRLVWLAAAIATGGLYLLSMTSSLRMERGDLLVLISAFFWALQIHIIGHFAPNLHPIKLAMVEFLTVFALSTAAGFLLETPRLSEILKGWLPLLYAGVFSAGIAYTIQVVAQRKTPPAPAAIIMSSESVFAVLGGWLLLGETLTAREISGCLLMLAGMVLAQINPDGNS